MRIVFFSAIAISLRVFGQIPAELPSRQTMLDEAQKARDAGDHERALSLASRAGEMRMTPSVRLFIAQEQRAVGQLANSMNNAELCAREAIADKTLRNRQTIISNCRSLISKIQNSAARILILISDPIPYKLQVSVDGHVLPETVYGKYYFTTAGKVTLEASAPGHLPFRKELVVESGKEATVTIEMSRDFGTPPPAPVQAPEPRQSVIVSTAAEEEKGSFREIGPYVVLGTGAASLGASAIFLALRNSAVNDLDAQCGGPSHTICPDTPEVRSLKNKASSYNTWTNVTLGIGAAALIGGGAWLLWEKTHPSKKSTQAKLQITPTEGGAVVGIAGAL
jgi:hypothetical protein